MNNLYNSQRHPLNSLLFSLGLVPKLLKEKKVKQATEIIAKEIQSIKDQGFTPEKSLCERILTAVHISDTAELDFLTSELKQGIANDDATYSDGIPSPHFSPINLARAPSASSYAEADPEVIRKLGSFLAKFPVPSEREQIRVLLLSLGVLDVESTLSEGTFGVVTVLETKKYGDVAVKLMKERALKEATVTGITPERLGGEAEALRLDLNPHVIHTHALIIRDSKGAIRLIEKRDLAQVEKEGGVVLVSITQFIEAKNLQTYFLSHKTRDHAVLKPLTNKLLELISHLHKSGIIHRDLNMENILVDEQGDPYLIDLGLSKNCDKLRTKTLCGNYYLRSPEMILGLEQTDKMDVWALGSLFYFLKFRCFPFFGKNPVEYGQELERYQKSGLSLLDFFEARSKEVGIFFDIAVHYAKQAQRLKESFSMDDCHFENLLTALLHSNPKKRPSAQEALKHEYFSVDLTESYV